MESRTLFKVRDFLLEERIGLYFAIKEIKEFFGKYLIELWKINL